MAQIQCSEIQQSLNYLLNAFDNCHRLNLQDLHQLVETVQAVYTCSGNGVPYDTLIQEVYEPINDTLVSYPANSFHAISIMILEGKITQDINGNIVEFPTGTTLNYEVTNYNQTPYTFTVKGGAKVVIEYLIETI